MSQEKTLEELKTEYEDYLGLFEHPMWAKFIETQEETLERDRKNAHRDFLTGDQWQQFRGHVFLMERILGFEDMIRATIDQITEAIAERDAEEEESDFED